MAHMELPHICVLSNPIALAMVKEIADRNILRQPNAQKIIGDVAEVLFVLLDALDGDLDLEDGDIDCCAADDDHVDDIVPQGAWWLARAAGDPSVAEEDGDGWPFTETTSVSSGIWSEPSGSHDDRFAAFTAEYNMVALHRCST